MHEEPSTARFGRILVVDDAAANLQLLHNLLTAHGYAVHPASSGELALDFVRILLPDLILLDIRMPGLDGFEVCRRLKASERTRSIPVIFISILEDERDKVKGFREGAVDYITKPFQAEEVLARVQTHLHLRELTEHLEQKVAERTKELQAANARLQTGIAERKQAEQEREKLQKQFIQAQKMESVGRLAGGVAHDFNNKLAVIMGYADMALRRMDQTEPLYKHLLEIRKAAESSANLTRQLLAFARKQTISPVALDLNQTVESMLKMLRRLIGENISLIWMPGAELWPVNMDPTQLDQILANLCVNARDAIADVGKVAIQTQNFVLDEEYCASHADAAPGEYVQLTVNDSGCGMDKETLDRIFEPFFTTKEADKGTGLGLATVYGIVRQNNGFISVYSVPEYGTAFRIYLPRHDVSPEQVREESAATPTARGEESILLVEDDAAILNFAKIFLESLGYMVLAASTPGEALRIAEERSGEISLLLTDVIMPEMTGRDLADKLSHLYPSLRKLFMSGYTSDIIAHHGVLDNGVNFIQKPFSTQSLATRVREILDSE